MHTSGSPPRLLKLGLRAVVMLAVALLLVSGLVGGLLRAGVPVPLSASSAWPGHAVLAHAFLMMCGFLGTVIGIERAVAAKARAAWASPIASALAGWAALNGALSLAAWSSVFAALAFVMVNASMWLRQRQPHMGVLLAGAAAWLVGALLFALGGAVRGAAAVPWWFSFLILTIAGERLEMTRLMRRRAGATAALAVVLAVLLLGSALFAVRPDAGAIVFGGALLALAAWLATFDIARRTIASHGLSRYMAVALLIGYAWLGVAGAAWIATALGQPLRDLALHALGVGFVFSMIFAHAPVILPALTGIKVHFGLHFYLPLALLHASLAMRVPSALDVTFLSAGALGHGVAIAVFMVTLLGSAAAWRLKHPERHALPAHH
ncbi:MAG: hypothetical protein KIT60_08345 [Burkholderiaceae bacterium]|nr:hypothetical protein [Burkholderiaceae bacterium]